MTLKLPLTHYSVSKHLVFVTEGAHPVKKPINCVYSYLNIYKSVCGCVYCSIYVVFVFCDLFKNASHVSQEVPVYIYTHCLYIFWCKNLFKNTGQTL